MISSFAFRHPAKLLLQTLLLLILGTQWSSARTFTYRYFRFHPTHLRSSTDAVQLSEFRFYNGAVPVTGATVSEPFSNSPATETPPNAFDGNITTKWLNRGYLNANLTFDFGSAVSIDRYNFVTGNDFVSRDPIGWTIEGSSDNETWVVLDAIREFPTSETRYAPASAQNLIFPENPPAFINDFSLSTAQIVDDGSQIEFHLSTSNAQSAVITSDIAGSLPISAASPDNDYVTVYPPAGRDTTYTLTAQSAAGEISKSLTIRTVKRVAQNFRYVRYTPVKVRGGAKTIGMSGFQFWLGNTPATPVAVTNPGGVSTAAQGVANLIDVESGTATQWVSSTLSPVIFDFGTSGGQFNAYAFSTGAGGAETDPVQWLLEGSNDTTTWALIDNVTSFDHSTTRSRNSVSYDLPIPGVTVAPYASLVANAPFIPLGFSFNLTYATVGATSLTLTPAVATPGFSGTVSVSPQATTTYELTATNGAGKSTVRTLTVPVIPISGAINYPNFETAPEINLLGAARILNDVATFPNSPNAKRLRLTGLVTNQTGSAWALSKIKVDDGFETSFDTHIAFPVYVNGADGIAFTIQDTAEKYNAVPTSELQLPSRAVSIVLDSFPDRADETQANLEVYQGTTRVAIYNLDKKGAKVARGYDGTYLVTQPTAAPYRVKISYSPGALSVSVDGVLVADRLAIDLVAAGATDAEGKSYLGFSAKTRNIVAYHDVVNWTVTPGAPVAAGVLELIHSSVALGAAPEVSLTFKSTAGKTYRVTRSGNLLDWSPLGADIVANGPTTLVTRPFTADTKGFFRVESVD